ncbi:MAG: TRZ/ATZ family hydrolase [Agarilytica sp.]
MIDFIIKASWIIPVVPQSRVLENCAIALNGDTIIDIGLPHEIDARYEAKTDLDLKGHALIPGFINTHGHAAMTLLRGYADDKSLMDWLPNYIWPAEQRWVNDRFVADGTRLAIAEMLLSGTTCFSDMYFFPEEVASVALEAGIRAQLTFPILDFPTIWANGPDEYLRKGVALHDQFRANPLIKVGFGPHAPYTVSDEPLKRIVTYAEELQAPIQIHLHETATEIKTATEQSGRRPIERLHELGLFTPLTQCVHMTQLEESEINLLSDTGAHVVHCPESNLKLASGICPTAKLLDMGINVCLGTDGAASNNDLDLSGDMRTAALIGKIAANDASAIDAMTALEMATINGAKAMGMENTIGSLEIGKKADLIAVDLNGLQHKPLYDPISQLVYTSIGHKIAHSWVNGRQLVKDFQLQTLDTTAIKSNARRWQVKMSND